MHANGIAVALLFLCVVFPSAIAVEASTWLVGEAGGTVSPVSMGAAGGGESSHYELEFICPTGGPGGPLYTETIRLECPFRIMDEEDSLGSPTLVVNPNNPNEMAIASLHGSGAPERPTPRTRAINNGAGDGSGYFTVFTSTDGGYNWKDQPSNAFQPRVDAADVYGEHTVVEMDNQGLLYGASAFSTQDQDDDHWSGAVAAWKWGGADAEVRWQDVHDLILPLDSPATIHGLDLTYVPAAADNATAGPGANKVVMTWMERAEADGGVSVLRSATTTTRDEPEWKAGDSNRTVGPCSSVSNGVAWGESVYVACRVADAQAYTHRPRAREGDLDVWRIEPHTGDMEYVSTAPLRYGVPRITATPEGRFAMASAEVADGSRVSVEVALGWHGSDWLALANQGSSLHTGAPNIVEVRIQDVAYVSEPNIVHVLYQEVYPPITTDLSLSGSPGSPQFSKRLATFNECEGNLGVVDLSGGVIHQYVPFGTERGDLSVFNDLVDGLFILRDAFGAEREFLAYGDLGVIAFAEIANRFAPQCAMAGFPPPPPAQGFPAAQLATANQGALSAQNLLMAAGAGVLTLAALVRLLASQSSVLARVGVRGGGRK